jgi:DMSO reductase anchor subunit
MARREWPLIGFTLLAQTGVGFFVVFTLPFVLAGDSRSARPAVLRSLALALAFLATAAVLSFFHLGKPVNAWRTLGNLGDSWLSREILFLLLTTGLLAAIFVLEWARGGSRMFVVGVAAALSGAALILSMANIYRLEAVPSWNNAMTVFSFFMTAALVGTLGASAASAIGILRSGEGPHPLAGGLAQAALILAVVDFAAVFLFDPNFGTAEAAGARAVGSESPAGYRGIFLIRLALLFIAGLGVAAILLRGGLGITDPFARGAIVMALIAGLASEGLGRVLFYALFRKDGL